LTVLQTRAAATIKETLVVVNRCVRQNMAAPPESLRLGKLEFVERSHSRPSYNNQQEPRIDRTPIFSFRPDSTSC
jgi:hypothetical protein